MTISTSERAAGKLSYSPNSFLASHTGALFERAKERDPTSDISIAVVPHLGNTKPLVLTDLAFIKCTVFPSVYFI